MVEQSSMERELKLQIEDSQGYQRLAQLLGQPQKRLEQVNTYLVNDRSLQDRRSLLRVRRENAQAILTCKLDGQEQDGYHQTQEYELEVDEDCAARLESAQPQDFDWTLEPLQRFAERFGREGLRTQGKLSNLRHSFGLANGDVAELDWTTFPDGHSEYELEVETEDLSGLQEILRPLLERASLAWTPQSKSKYRRFLDCLPG